jgi:hypothetical protein
MSGFIIGKHEGGMPLQKWCAENSIGAMPRAIDLDQGLRLSKIRYGALALLQQPLTANRVYSVNQFCRSWNQKYRQQYKS